MWCVVAPIPLLGLWGLHSFMAHIGGYEYDYIKTLHRMFTSEGAGSSLKNLREFWFHQTLYNGVVFPVVAFAGTVGVIARSLYQRISAASPGFRSKLWAALAYGNSPASVLAVLVLYALVLWGPYWYQVPRNQAEVVFLWPIMAAAAMILPAEWLGKRLSRPVWIVGVAAACGLSILGSTYAARLVYMGRGLAEAYEFVERKGLTCWGRYSAWSCERNLKMPYGWEINFSDYLEKSDIDCWLADYNFDMHHSAYYQPAGRMIYFEMCNELARNHQPLFRSKYVSHVEARTSNAKFFMFEHWTKHPLAPYVDVWDKPSVIQAHRVARARAAEHIRRQQQPGGR